MNVEHYKKLLKGQCLGRSIGNRYCVVDSLGYTKPMLRELYQLCQGGIPPNVNLPAHKSYPQQQRHKKRKKKMAANLIPIQLTGQNKAKSVALSKLMVAMRKWGETRLTQDNQEEIEGHDKLFLFLLAILERNPVNDIFTQKVYQNISPNNKSMMGDQYMFVRQKTTGGLIDTDKCFSSVKIDIKSGANPLSINKQFNVLPWPLRTWFSQVNVLVNGISINVDDLHNMETDYVKNLTRDVVFENEDV